MIHAKSAREKLNTRLFNAVHGRNLVYNTCWEDPALDRVALDFRPDDRVMVISSAGCNALDYLLAGAGEVNAVDVNPIQNALVELKVAGIKALDHGSFFELFGDGGSPRARELYRDTLRQHLSPFAARYWDKKIGFFSGRGWRQSFYYHGTCGLFAKLLLTNTVVVQRLRGPLEEMLEAKTIDEQRAVYEKIKPKLWKPWVKWFLSRNFTMALVGVPWPQRDQIVNGYPGGVAQFIRDAMEAVVTQLPFSDNYFYRVYLQGRYTRECCPEYLKADNFDRLKSLIGRLKVHTSTVTHFLNHAEPGISKFVLLDHMDWMNHNNPHGLVDEWGAILEKARPGARAIYRSAGLKVGYLDHLKVRYRGETRELGALLKYHPEMAAELHARDRVHTYGSFYIADLP